MSVSWRAAWSTQQTAHLTYELPAFVARTAPSRGEALGSGMTHRRPLCTAQVFTAQAVVGEMNSGPTIHHDVRSFHL